MRCELDDAEVAHSRCALADKEEQTVLARTIAPQQAARAVRGGPASAAHEVVEGPANPAVLLALRCDSVDDLRRHVLAADDHPPDGQSLGFPGRHVQRDCRADRDGRDARLAMLSAKWRFEQAWLGAALVIAACAKKKCACSMC